MNTQDSNHVHTLSLVTRDQPGVLVRIALVFARRGRNIESLAVSPGATSGYSRMTITSRGNPETLTQIIRQLAKLVDVVDVLDHLEHPPLEAEVALVKIDSNGLDVVAVADQLNRDDAARVEVVDQTANVAVLRVMGETDEVEEAIAAIAEKRALQELVRSGPVAMDKGPSHYGHLIGKPLR